MKLAGPFAALAFATLGTGCLWANEKSDSMWGLEARTVLASDGHVEGGQLHAIGGFAGLYADVEANARDATRPEKVDTLHAYGLGISTRASLFGIFGTTHELERYLDLGGEAGVGGGIVPGGIVPTGSVAGFSAGWVGAWVEVGTISVGKGSYLAVTGGIRREMFGAPFDDQTQLAIGLAWRHREPVGPMHWHD